MGKALNTIYAVGAVLIYICAHVSYSKEIIFYDDDGSVFTLTISGGCYNFKPKWDRRATLVDIDQGCFKLWDRPDCRGQNVQLGRNEGESHDLKKKRFGAKVRSVNLCSPAEEDKQRNMGPGGNGSKPAGPKLTASNQEIQDIAVAEHNKYRKLHGVPDLKGDAMIHVDAQKYAEYLATSNKFEPTTMGKYGTNIASSFRRNKVDAVKDAIKRWYDKGQFYDYSRPGYNVGGKPTGSFTAVVWKATTHLGIGVAWNEADEGYIIVAFYSPAANMRSKFRENVLPPVASSTTAAAAPSA